MTISYDYYYSYYTYEFVYIKLELREAVKNSQRVGLNLKAEGCEVMTP